MVQNVTKAVCDGLAHVVWPKAQKCTGLYGLDPGVLGQIGLNRWCEGTVRREMQGV